MTPMTPERWREITALFDRALALDEASRGSFLDRACAGDRDLRDEVARLLDAHQKAGAFGMQPIAALSDDESRHAYGETARTTIDEVVRPGAMLGRYRIEGLLGRGGMGAVFLAYDATLDRRIALKVLDNPSDQETSRSRLLREARSAAALNHPNICTIHEVGEADGTAFIAMEYVEGRSLRELLDDAPLTSDAVVRYGIQAADALAHAHEHGVVHRDFKAANVIVTAAGRLTIVDFGLARRAHTGGADPTRTASHGAAAAGTPYAMAPEQVRGGPGDPRTDVWALGVLLHEMLGGAKPFDAPTVSDLFSSILRDPPAPLPESAPPAIAAVVNRCLAKEPAQRYQHGREVHTALSAVGRDATAPQARRGGRRQLAATAIALAVLGVLVGFNIGGSRDRLLGTPSRKAIMLAVLPFENLTGDPAQEFFSDGLTEELISQLGRLNPDRLHVIARTSAMRYKHSDVAIDRIGAALGAEYVIEGSARREGSRVRISARLVHTADQTQRWTKTFERDLAGVLGLQRDVAEAVAESLALTLLPRARQDLGATKLVNPEAYEAYLAGRNLVPRMTRADLDTAEKYFNLALSKDPSYALGYAGLSLVWGARQQAEYVPPAEAAPKVRAAASKALELDEQLPEAHLQLANLFMWTDWNWPAAEPEYRRAITLRPNYADARAFYSQYLYIMKRPAEGQAEMRQAIETDPLSEFVRILHGLSLVMDHRYQDAEAHWRVALTTGPNSPVALTGLSESLHYQRRYDEALEAERALWRARADPETDAALGQGLGEAGYSGAMRRAAEIQGRRSIITKVLPLAVAKLYARSGQHVEQQIEWLERAVESHDPNVPYIAVMPIFDGLHAVPRFQRLVNRLNLPM